MIPKDLSHPPKQSLSCTYEKFPTSLPHNETELKIDRQKDLKKSEDHKHSSLHAKLAFRRAVDVAVNLSRGASNRAKLMNQRYWGEVIHESHGYGKTLHELKKIWDHAETQENFNVWLNKLEAGKEVPGKERIEPKFMVDGKLNIPHVTYLNKADLQRHKLSVDQEGRISTELTREYATLEDEDTTYSYIFVVSPDRKIYLGRYIQGYFHHSSFLSGGPVLSAGELTVKNGKIISITDKSGHYLTNKLDLLKGLHAFIQSGVDLRAADLKTNALSLFFTKSFNLFQYYFDNLINNQETALSFLTQKEYREAVQHWEQIQLLLAPPSQETFKNISEKNTSQNSRKNNPPLQSFLDVHTPEPNENNRTSRVMKEAFLLINMDSDDTDIDEVNAVEPSNAS